jgi:hypothetical protein
MVVFPAVFFFIITRHVKLKTCLRMIVDEGITAVKKNYHRP